MATKIICKWCDEAVGENDNKTGLYSGGYIHDKCLAEAEEEGMIGHCPLSGDWDLADEMVWVQDVEELVTANSYESDCFRCASCSTDYTLAYMSDQDSTCQSCEDSPDENVLRQREYDKGTKDFISEKTSGKTIQSLRPFGIEVELVNDSQEELVKLGKSVSKSFGFVHDGSIQGNNPIEIVSPVLAGLRGERAVCGLFDDIKKHKCDINNSCGLHVHLSANEFKKSDNIKYCQVKDVTMEMVNQQHNRTYVLSKKLIDKILENKPKYQVSKIVNIINTNAQHMSGGLVHNLTSLGFKNGEVRCHDTSITVGDMRFYTTYYFLPTEEEVKEADEKAKEFSKAKAVMVASLTGSGLSDAYNNLIKKYGGDSPRSVKYIKANPSSDDVFSVIEIDNSVENLKALLYLYTAYSDVFIAMLPMSRRQNNRHIQKLNNAFSPVDIAMVRTHEDMEKLWYKSTSEDEMTDRKSKKYDQSRYYGVNFHSLFSSNGTIEIRWHSATLDAQSVLYWVALHQHILDSIGSRRVDIRTLRSGIDIYGVKDKRDFLLSVLNMRPSLERYVTARFDHFYDGKK